MLFRRDRERRKGGGVAIYVRRSVKATVCKPPVAGDNRGHELLWIKTELGCDVTFVGALYHPPVPVYQTTRLLDYMEAAIVRIQLDFAGAEIIMAGDLNLLSDTEIIVRTGMSSIVTLPTRGNNYLDRIYVLEYHYSGIKVVKSVATSDHMAIIAYSGEAVKTVGKTRRVCKFRKHTVAQHANFSSSVHIVNKDGDPQDEFDRLYNSMTVPLDAYHPERTVTIMSADPPYVMSRLLLIA